MSRYKPTPTQVRALRSVADRRVIRTSLGAYRDRKTGETITYPTMLRLLREGLVTEPAPGDLFEVTADGRALLAALDGAS